MDTNVSLSSRKRFEQGLVNGSNIFVKNINRLLQSEDVIQYFSQFGSILSCKLVENQYHNKPNFAYILFSSPEQAQNAIQNAHNHTLIDMQLNVSLAINKTNKPVVRTNTKIDQLLLKRDEVFDLAQAFLGSKSNNDNQSKANAIKQLIQLSKEIYPDDPTLLVRTVLQEVSDEYLIRLSTNQEQFRRVLFSRANNLQNLE